MNILQVVCRKDPDEGGAAIGRQRHGPTECIVRRPVGGQELLLLGRILRVLGKLRLELDDLGAGCGQLGASRCQLGARNGELGLQRGHQRKQLLICRLGRDLMSKVRLERMSSGPVNDYNYR